MAAYATLLTIQAATTTPATRWRWSSPVSQSVSHRQSVSRSPAGVMKQAGFNLGSTLHVQLIYATNQPLHQALPNPRPYTNISLNPTPSSSSTLHQALPQPRPAHQVLPHSQPYSKLSLSALFNKWQLGQGVCQELLAAFMLALRHPQFHQVHRGFP